MRHTGSGIKDVDDRPRKFYQLGGAAANPEVVPAGFGPFGVIVGGWTDDELEYVVGPTLEEAHRQRVASAAMSVDSDFLFVPVRVLSQGDLDRPLGEVLETIQSMDGVMPELGDDARLKRPLLIFSGWLPEKMLDAVRKFRNMVALRQVSNAPMAAMAVPRAVNKLVRQLVEEIDSDFEANQQR